MKSNTEYSRLKLDKKWKRNTNKNYIQFNNIAIKSVKADYNLLFTKITGVK